MKRVTIGCLVLIGQVIGLVLGFLVLAVLHKVEALRQAPDWLLVFGVLGLLAVAVPAILLQTLGPLSSQGWGAVTLVSVCSAGCVVGVVATYVSLAPARDAGLTFPSAVLLPFASVLGSVIGLLALGRRGGGDAG